jgi:lipopolysaccharide transport system permease protein/teichoic acid transport system permease protein
MTARSLELTVGRPRRGALGSIAESLVALVQRRRLIWYLADSSLRSKGENSLFGNAWLIIDPTLQLAIYYLLVGVILRRPEPAFPLFLFAAILPWRWFTQAITSSTESVRRMGKVMQQIVFPQIVLPFASIGASLGSFVFGFIPLLALYAVYQDRISAWILALPLVMIVQLLWTLPLAIILSAANVFYGDISNLVKHFLRLAFYLSPALFSYDKLLKAAESYPLVVQILHMNPMAWVLIAYRDLLYYGRSPDWFGLLIVGALSIPFTLLSIYIFNRLSPGFAKVL